MRIETISAAYPSCRSAYYVSGLIFLATTFGFLDRQVLSILIGPIKHDLGATDAGMSVKAFIAVY